MVLIPGGAAQCACPILFQCSWGLYPKTGQPAYGRYDFQPPLVPVQQVALNLGAPGDRRDAQGTLWLQVPNRVHQWRWAAGKFFDDPRAGYFFNEAASTTVQGTPSPWIYASGARGLREFSVPVVDKDAAKDSAPAVYTVRLHFAEPDGLEAGRRVFHVAICGNEVLRDFDTAREAGGPHRAVVKEFRGIRVAENLVVELTPSDAAEVKLPVLCGVEIVRQP